jgi:hypothetical protein
MIVALGLESGSCLVHLLCSNLYITGIDYYTRREVCGLHILHFVHRFCIGFMVFIALWDIAHGALLQLLACKVPPCAGVAAQ